MDKNFLMKYWFKNTEEMVFFKDKDGKYQLVSDACVRLTGSTDPATMEGKYDVEVYPTQLAQAFIAQDKQVMKTGKPVIDIDNVSNELVGDIIIETHKFPVYDENGNVVGVSGVARNVTERYQLLEQMKTKNIMIKNIIDTFPFPIWVKNKENCYILVNKAYNEFYEISEDKIKNRNVTTTLTIQKMFSEETIAAMQNHDEYVMKSQKPSKMTVDIFKDGKNLKLEIVKAPLTILTAARMTIMGYSRVIG